MFLAVPDETIKLYILKLIWAINNAYQFYTILLKFSASARFTSLLDIASYCSLSYDKIQSNEPDLSAGNPIFGNPIFMVRPNERSLEIRIDSIEILSR